MTLSQEELGRRDPCFICPLPDCREKSPKCLKKKLSPTWKQSDKGKAYTKKNFKEWKAKWYKKEHKPGK